MMTAKAMLAMAAPLLTPKILGSTCGAITLGLVGAGLMKWSGSKSGLEFRRKLATSVRDSAQDMIDKLEDAAGELEKTVKEKGKKRSVEVA